MDARLLHRASHHGDEDREFSTPERCFILELWNHEADPDVSIARARVEPGVVTELHSLSVDERYLIVSGTGRVEVAGPCALVRDVGPGDVVLIPRHVPQRIENTGTEDLVFYCVCTPRFSPACYRSLEASLEPGQESGAEAEP